MTISPISLGTRSNPNRNDTQATLVNCYAEPLGEENEAQWAIYACDGFQSFASLITASDVRGMFNLDDTLLWVATGDRLQTISTSGTTVDRGPISTSGYAYFARNRKTPVAQIAMVTSDGAFRMIEGGSITTPSVDPDIPTFNSVCGINGYFILTASNGEWYITSIDEGNEIDELEFAQANTNPDGIIRGMTRGQDVAIFGPRSVEFYQLTGATDFPFERTTSVNFGLAYGPSAVNLIAIIDGETQDTIIFAGNNADGSYAGIMMLSGYGARKISTPDVDRAIRDEPTKSSIRAFTRIDNGHVMYCVTGTSFTREYNCDTQRWHTRKSSALSIWRANEACQFNGSTILAEYSGGALYKQSHTLTPGSASTISMRHSNNGGASWSPARTRNVGSSKAKRVRYPQLGQSREDGKVFELTFSNALVENGTGTDAVVITPPVHAFPRPMEFNSLFVNITSGTSQTSSAKGFVNLAVDAAAIEA